MSRNKFNFFIPAEIEKGLDKEGNAVIKVKGICSDDNKDSDEEYLHPSGYDLTYFLSNGFINYNHRAKDDPSSIIGEPTMAKIVNNGTQMYMEGILFPSNKKALAVCELAQTLAKYGSTRKLGWSIEGSVIERDPMNPKKITKAKITGVAITPCPKNHNTFVDLVKGEYSDEFIKDDEDDEEEKPKNEEKQEENKDKEKAMGANPALIHEDVEGKPKYLTKSELYSEIFTRFSPENISESKKIFNFVTDICKSLNNDNTQMGYSKEAVLKVFSLFEEADNIEKSIKSKPLKKGDSPQEIEEEEKQNPGIPVAKPKKAIEPTGSNVPPAPQGPSAPEEDEPEDDEMAKCNTGKMSIKKGEEDDDEDIDEVAKGFCKDNGDKDMDKDDLVEKLIRKGFGLKASESSASKVLAAFAKQKNGSAEPEKLTMTVDKLEKSLESVLESIELIQDSSNEIQNNIIKSIADDINPKFKSMGNMFLEYDKTLEEIKKSQDEILNKYKQEVDIRKGLEDEIVSLNSKLNELENYTPTRKSVLSPNSIERFAKSQSQFGKSLDLRNKDQRRKAIDMLYTEFTKSEGSDKEIEKSIKSMELGANPSEYIVSLFNRQYNTDIIVG